MMWRARGALPSVAAITGAITVVACGGSSPSASPTSTPGGSCQGSSGVASTTTASYVVVLDVGPPEVMYSQDQVNSQHPTTGEVMLGGAMTDVSGAGVQHLEAHICNKSSGSVVTGASPTITVQDTTAGTPSQDLPVAEMQGVTASTSDYHYGNNTVLRSGHTFAITVKLNGETANLSYHAS
ncbi:MAG: hypothetical protein JOZ75_03910 [Candidatus Dormibacteraeota bacterium]|nr:hypothetical protein [Candidatus Dormibacteraeota bacterium]